MASTVEGYKQQLQLQQENHDTQMSEVMGKLQETQLQVQQVHLYRLIVHVVFLPCFLFSFLCRNDGFKVNVKHCSDM